jgi:hypothetical protein
MFACSYVCWNILFLNVVCRLRNFLLELNHDFTDTILLFRSKYVLQILILNVLNNCLNKVDVNLHANMHAAVEDTALGIVV